MKKTFARSAGFMAVFLGVTATSLGIAHAQAQNSQPGSMVQPLSEKLINFDADNTSLTQVLQELAARSGLNIVTGAAVAGKTITIHLRDTPFDEALNLVVRAAGLGYERIGRSVLVADPQVLSTETGAQSRVFTLHYIGARDAQELLKNVTEDVTSYDTGNVLVVRGSQSTIEQAEAVISELDRKPGQILIEARLIEVNTTALLEAGIDWEKITKWQTVVTEGNQGPSRPGQLPEDSPFIKIDHSEDYYRQLASWQVAIDALLTDGKARLLSNSKVVTIDNRPAEIFAGQTVPVVITSLSSPGQAGGTLQTVQLEKIDVGVKLDITAHASEDGLITVLAQPEVSRIIAFVGPNDDLPETSTRRAKTFVRVHDGERIYLGGLLSEEKTSTVKKVPILGSIPVIGYLFRHYRTETSKLDLVIEITPKIVGDQGSVLPTAPPIEGEMGQQ